MQETCAKSKKHRLNTQYQGEEHSVDDVLQFIAVWRHHTSRCNYIYVAGICQNEKSQLTFPRLLQVQRNLVTRSWFSRTHHRASYLKDLPRFKREEWMSKNSKTSDRNRLIQRELDILKTHAQSTPLSSRKTLTKISYLHITKRI